MRGLSKVPPRERGWALQEIGRDAGKAGSPARAGIGPDDAHSAKTAAGFAQLERKLISYERLPKTVQVGYC